MTYIIAELGSIPDGSVGNAIRLIEECANAGVDAVKLQDHRHERIKGAPPWQSQQKQFETREEYLRRTAYSQHYWQLIRATATACNVDLVVSPFSVEAVALLEELPVDAYKVASGQVTNRAMLEAIGKTGRRVFLSSGMTTEDETSVAGDCLNLPRVCLMHCTSEYPCDPSNVGLNLVIDMLKFPWLTMTVDVGFSDHTLGFAASLAAIALGATVIERHVCFDRRQYGTDARHSLTLDELRRFVGEVRSLDVMLANPVDKEAQVNSREIQRMREAFLERS